MNNQNKIDPSQYTAHLHPGKFQGETAAVEYFYEEMLNGVGETIYDESDTTTDEYNGCYPQAELFQIEAEEADAFNLTTGHYFLLWEDSQGFVYGKTYPTRSEATSFFNSRQ